jgi:hypothetical protein
VKRDVAKTQIFWFMVGPENHHWEKKPANTNTSPVAARNFVCTALFSYCWGMMNRTEAFVAFVAPSVCFYVAKFPPRQRARVRFDRCEHRVQSTSLAYSLSLRKRKRLFPSGSLSSPHDSAMSELNPDGNYPPVQVGALLMIWVKLLIRL